MKLQEARERAKPFSLKARGLSKKELILAIQRAEGNTPCFGKASPANDCGQYGCCWREECFAFSLR